MLEHYFDTPSTLEQLRSCDVGAHIDGFSAYLKERGYSRPTGSSYLLTAAHLFRFLEDNDVTLESLDCKVVEQFRQHLHHCDCRKPNGGNGKPARYGAGAYYRYLRGIGAVSAVDDEKTATLPLLVQSFRHWLKQHLGAAESTLYHYCRGASQLVGALGDEPSQYDAGTLRAFVLERARHSGKGATQVLITGLRSFLRAYSSHRERRIQSKLNSESGEAERSSKR